MKQRVLWLMIKFEDVNEQQGDLVERDGKFFNELCGRSTEEVQFLTEICSNGTFISPRRHCFSWAKIYSLRLFIFVSI